MDFKNFNKVRFEAHEFNVNDSPEDENFLDNTGTINQTETITGENTLKIEPDVPISQPMPSQEIPLQDQYHQEPL